MALRLTRRFLASGPSDGLECRPSYGATTLVGSGVITCLPGVHRMPRRGTAGWADRVLSLLGRAAVVAAGLAVLVGCPPEPAKTHLWLGINTHLGDVDRGDTGGGAPTAAARRDLSIALLGELGASRIRDRFMNWADVQPTADGPYDFSQPDDLVRRAQAADLDVLVVCGSIPRWAAADGPAGAVGPGLPDRAHLEAFNRVVQAFVERYDGDGREDMPELRHPLRAYEFLNAIETFSYAEYAFWLRHFHQAVKAADLDVRVVLGELYSPGLRTFDQPEGDYPTYFEQVLAAAEPSGSDFPYFDAVGFRQFPRRYPGREPFDHAVGYLRQVMRGRQIDRRIWLTAFGAPGGGQTEARQATDLVKWILRGRALGLERIYLHCLRDGPAAGHTPVEQRMGLVGRAEKGQIPPRKASFGAVAQLIRELEERPRVTYRGRGRYLLTGRGDPVHVLWKDNELDPSPAPMVGWWTVRTLAGRTLTRQGTEIEFTTSPLFLERTRSPFLDRPEAVPGIQPSGRSRL